VRLWPLTQKQKDRVAAVTAALVPTMARTCVTCKWIAPNAQLKAIDGVKYAKCIHPNNIRKDPARNIEEEAFRMVTGEEPPKQPIVYEEVYCSHNRTSTQNNRCGRTGAWWEPKG
jgi:hypothetical protein